MTQILGTRYTTNINQERRVVDMGKQIALLDPNASPFVSFLKLARHDSRCVYNPRFEWLEDDLPVGEGYLAEAVSSDSATSIYVNEAYIFRPNDVIFLPAVNEYMLVSTTSQTKLTVVRAYAGSTAAASIEAGSKVINIGPAMPENASRRNNISTLEKTAFNYTQIFRTSIALSGTENASALHGGRDRAYMRRKASLEHKRDIARAMYFGRAYEDTSGSAPRRTMGGLLSFMENSGSATFDKSSLPLTYHNFDLHVAKEAFAHGSGEKLLIAGPNLASAINCWAENKLVRDVDSESTYGIRVKDLITTYGDLKVIYDPLLDNLGFADYGMIVDVENVRYVYLNGRDTKLNIDVQDNDLDGVADEYLTECSLEVKLPQTHFLIKGAYIE